MAFFIGPSIRLLFAPKSVTVSEFRNDSFPSYQVGVRRRTAAGGTLNAIVADGPA